MIAVLLLLLCAAGLWLAVQQSQRQQRSWERYRLRVDPTTSTQALERALRHVLHERGGGLVWTVAEPASDMALVLELPPPAGAQLCIADALAQQLPTAQLHLARVRTLTLPARARWRSVVPQTAGADWRGPASATLALITARGTVATLACDATPAPSWQVGWLALHLPQPWMLHLRARLAARRCSISVLPPVMTTRGMHLPSLPSLSRTLAPLAGPTLTLGWQADRTPLHLPLAAGLRLQLVGATARTDALLADLAHAAEVAHASCCALLEPTTADAWLASAPDRQRCCVLDYRQWGTSASLDLRSLPDPLLLRLLGELAALDASDPARWLLPAAITWWRQNPTAPLTALLALLCDPPQALAGAANYSSLERRTVGLRWMERLAPLLCRRFIGLLAQPGVDLLRWWQAGGTLLVVLPDAPLLRAGWGLLLRALLEACVDRCTRPLLLLDQAGCVPTADQLPVGLITTDQRGRANAGWSLLLGGATPSATALPLAKAGLHPLSLAFLSPHQRVLLPPDASGALLLAAQPPAAPAHADQRTRVPSAASLHHACQLVLAQVESLLRRVPQSTPQLLSLQAAWAADAQVQVTTQWSAAPTDALQSALLDLLPTAAYLTQPQPYTLTITLSTAPIVAAQQPYVFAALAEDRSLLTTPWRMIGPALIAGSAWTTAAARVLGCLLQTLHPDYARLHLIGPLPPLLAPLAVAPHVTSADDQTAPGAALRALLHAQVLPDADSRLPLIVLLLDAAAADDRDLLPIIRQAQVRAESHALILLVLAEQLPPSLVPLLDVLPLIGDGAGPLRLRHPGADPQPLPCMPLPDLAALVADLPARTYADAAPLPPPEVLWLADPRDLAPAFSAHTPAGAQSAALPAGWMWTRDVVQQVIRGVLANPRRQLTLRIVQRLCPALSITWPDVQMLAQSLASIMLPPTDPRTLRLCDAEPALIWAAVDAAFPPAPGPQEVRG